MESSTFLTRSSSASRSSFASATQCDSMPVSAPHSLCCCWHERHISIEVESLSGRTNTVLRTVTTWGPLLRCLRVPHVIFVLIQPRRAKARQRHTAACEESPALTFVKSPPRSTSSLTTSDIPTSHV
jgi:hypothetical protein